MKDDFSYNVQLVLKYSKEEAVRLGHSYVGSEHLTLGLLKNKTGNVTKVLESIGCNMLDLKSMIEDLISPTSSNTMSLGPLPLTQRAEPI